MNTLYSPLESLLAFAICVGAGIVLSACAVATYEAGRRSKPRTTAQ